MSVIPDSNVPRPHGDPIPPSGAPEPDPAAARDEVVAGARPWGRAAAGAVGAALVAALLAWAIGEKMHDYYQPAMKGPVSRDFRELNRAEQIADQKNAALLFGTFGALLGLTSGAAGGALRRSISGGASAALAGLLLGGIGAALVSYEVVPLFGRLYDDETPSLLLSFLVRGGIWAVAGLTAGLALGWGWQGASGIPRALIGGLAGSVCSTIAFEVLNAVLFPADRNDAVIASSMPARLLADLLVAVGVAWGAVVFGRPRSRPAERTAAAHA